MRPVNLIPKEQRRDRASSRSGPLAYVIVAALFALLAGVVVIVLSSNQISERESELADLNAQKSAVQARADQLAPFTKFQQVQRQRTATISQLADSRFDWPRVIRQLSLIVPKYVVLTKLSGVAGGGTAEGGEASSGGAGLTGGVKGPSLSLVGCAANQKRVAALIVALRQIDGVTRVGLSSSVRSIPNGDSSSAGSGECVLGNASFSIAVAFDAAPASPDSASSVEAVPAAEEPAPESSGSSPSSSSSGSSPTESESSGSAETTIASDKVCVK